MIKIFETRYKDIQNSLKTLEDNIFNAIYSDFNFDNRLTFLPKKTVFWQPVMAANAL